VPHVSPGHLGSAFAAATEFRPRPVIRIPALASQPPNPRHRIGAHGALCAGVAPFCGAANWDRQTGVFGPNVLLEPEGLGTEAGATYDLLQRVPRASIIKRG